jgi:DNA-binding transcriptional regulator YiaG
MTDPIIDEPPIYNGLGVKQVREKLGWSQPLFAAMLGVKLETIEDVEDAGIDGEVRRGCLNRLLEHMEDDPEYWKKRLKSMARIVR